MKRVLFVSVLLLSALFTAGNGQAAVWPGPDSQGYTGTTIPFSFTDISGAGTAVVLADDAVSAAVPVGFTFNFYGKDYTALYISSNGFITFTAGPDSGCCEGQNIPSPTGPNNLIAGYWTDLNPEAGGSIHYALTGPAGSRQFRVQFLNIPLLSGGGAATFQLVLHEGSNAIEMQLKDCAANAAQTYVTGIENYSGSAALQYNYGNYSLSDVGIMFSPPVITITTQPADRTVCAGDNAVFTAAADSSPAPAQQWQRSVNNGLIWGSLPGETSAALTVTASAALNNNRYRAVFTNGGIAVSNAALLTVVSLTTLPAAVPAGTVGVSYTDTQFSTAGAAGTVTYTLAAGALPSGLSLSAGGLLSGTPGEAGSFPITVKATDAGGCFTSSSFTLFIGQNNMATVPAATGNGNITLITSNPNCWFSNVIARTEAAAGSDAAFDYPYGLVGFTLNCSAGDVTITFPGNISGSAYRNYGPTVPGDAGTAAWHNTPDATVAGSSVVLHLTDGQPGDDTGVNGSISALGGPAGLLPVNTTSVPVPAMTDWGLLFFALLAGAGAAVHLGRRPQPDTASRD